MRPGVATPIEVHFTRAVIHVPAVRYAISFGPNGEMVVLQGVYDLADDRLTIHFGIPGRPRPATLDPAAGMDTIHVILVRPQP